MANRIKKKIRKLNNNYKPIYIRHLGAPIEEYSVLLEGGQGSNINGNMFAMLRELCTNPRWSKYRAIFTVTDGTIEKARERMAFYGFENVRLVVRNSDEYCKCLATAKYLMTDNSFPPYFSKRSEQVFLNTWHGTPLKTLGKSDKSNLASLANIQKNYLMSDYALFPNEFTRNVFMDDYDLDPIFSGNELIANYPRNYVFYDENKCNEFKKKLGYENKKLFAYMPTWRGTGRTADTANQIKETKALLEQFDKKLSDDSLLLVNLHFLLASEIDCSEYKHIESFSPDYDTYEILGACDGLITDYSSVFFDFAVTKKKIILFAYDKEKYLETRGTYIPFEELPFPICDTVENTVAEMSVPVQSYDDFVSEYCPNGAYDCCEKIFELMVSGHSDFYSVSRHIPDDNICLLYAGTLPEVHFENIKRYISENPEYRYVIAYRHNFSKASKEFVLSLDRGVTTLGIITAIQAGIGDAAELFAHKMTGNTKDTKRLDSLFENEKNRLFYSVSPKKVVDFSCGNSVMAGVLSKMSGEKFFVRHGDYYAISKRFAKTESFVRSYELEHGFCEIDYREKENADYVLRNADNDIADGSFRKNSSMDNILPLYIKTKKRMKCISLFRLRTPVETRLRDTYISVGTKKYCPKYIAPKNKLSKSHFGIYSFDIPVKDVVDMPATNIVALCYRNGYDKLVQCHIIYFSLIYRIFMGLRGPVMYDRDTDTVAIFRQSKNNRLNVYVRSYIKSDKGTERFKQFVAYCLSLLWHGKKAKNLVMLYEKNSSKYEESASVTFEYLIDHGYKDAYFIVDRDYEYIDRIPEKYLPNIVYKHSFKHYLYFFKAKTFIGTEALVHAIDLKIFNLPALKKISDKNLNYVFLQHGVMYMVSLDSESRNMFNRKKLNGKYRVVVSSHAEADHFVELGGHYPEDLYITGLPKFDRNILLPTADKIVIMPTWRPWEINLARDDFSQTGYFKMVTKLYDSVPDELKDDVIILPHPLIVNELKNSKLELGDKVFIGARYDDVLKSARVLITDYSSIAYDAFYRGVRVIFYWEEKDYCMAQYGPSTKLMLNENNVYGDYFYSTDGLGEAIERNYNNPQPKEYKKRYSKIVEFHDGKNTQRLVEKLKEDGIINLS